MSWAIKLVRAEGTVDPPRCSGVLLPSPTLVLSLQVQSVRRLCGAPLLQGLNISGVS